MAALLIATMHDYWGDEIGSLEGAAQPLATIARGAGADFHPPLYFLLLHLWQRMWGQGEVAARSLSVLAACLTILLTRSLAARFGLKRPWLAGLFLALSPFWILFSGMVRYYSLAAALFVTGFLVLREAVDRGGWRWGAYAACVAAAGYTNYVLLVATVITHAVWVWRRCWRWWVAALAVGVAAMLPLYRVALAQTMGMISWGARAGFTSPWRALVLGCAYCVYVLAVSETILPWRWWVSVPLAGGSAWLALKAGRARLVLTLGAGILTGALVVVAVARPLPLVYLPSRLLFLAPLWAILLARGAENERGVGLAAVALVVAGYLVGDWNLVRGRDYHNVSYLVPWKRIAELVRQDQAEDKLLVTPEEYPLFYYGRGLRFQLVRPGESVNSQLAAKLPQVVWLVQRDRADRERRDITAPVEEWLDRHYRMTHHYEFVRLSPLERKVRTLILGREAGSAAVYVARYVRP